MCSSPVPALPPKPASPGPPKVEEVGPGGLRLAAELPPGVPVISLGHTNPQGQPWPPQNSAPTPSPLLQLSTLGTAPPPGPALPPSPVPQQVSGGPGPRGESRGKVLTHKALVTHDPTYSLYIGPLGTFQHLP